MSFRIGTGFDVHAFDESRKLILGGIEIPDAPGLAGHSDADVLIHAIIDSILGALALGDIGSWFPDTDKQFKNIDSKILLSTVMESEDLKGWQIENLDTTIIAQKPKLSKHITTMRQKLADTLNIDIKKVSVKATTTEKLGFTGRGEGIAAQASILLSK